MPRGQLRNRLSPEETNHDVGMLESGVSQRRIGRILIASLNLISRMWNRHRTNGDTSHRH